MKPRFACLIAVIGILALVMGCGEASKPAHPACHPVSGKLTYNGQAPQGAVIQLWPIPVDRNKWQERKPSAQVSEDGTFKVWTYESNDGAPEGEYAITVIWDSDGGGNPPGNDVFGARYSNPDQPVSKVTIKSGPNEIPAIALTGPAVKPPGGGG